MEHGLQLQRIANSRGELAFRCLERAIQHRGGLAFVRVQIDVSRGKRQPIRLAHRRANHDFRIHIQVARHLRDEPRLLRILASEVRIVRLHNLQQLHDHCRDAAEVAGP